MAASIWPASRDFGNVLVSQSGQVEFGQVPNSGIGLVALTLTTMRRQPWAARC
ncbi:MAG: hypothetical protein QM750_20590 [Rubrivivax sp.]